MDDERERGGERDVIIGRRSKAPTFLLLLIPLSFPFPFFFVSLRQFPFFIVLLFLFNEFPPLQWVII